MRYHTMKHTKQFWLPLTTILVMTVVGMSAHADMNASEIVSNFNSLNGNSGFRFDSNVTEPLVTVTAQVGTNNVDISAYAPGRAGETSGRTYFTTFCVQPNYTALSPGVGKLDYNPLNGHTANRSGIVLSLGSAYLYKQYATGALSVTQSTAEAFIAAMRVLNGIEILANWTSNTFLAGLASNRDYWLLEYDTRQRYDEIGDYCVFVMQVTATDLVSPGQDFLYLAHANYTAPPGVPEPAALLLWTLGGMGFAGASWRKRRMKKHALS